MSQTTSRTYFPEQISSPRAGDEPPARSFFAILKQAFTDWLEDKALKLSASLAFYTMLSIAPLLIIFLKIVSNIYRQGDAQQKIKAYLGQFVGGGASQVFDQIFANQPQGAGVLATIVSTILLVVSASGVFGELQDSLNIIWEVKPRPNRGIWETLKQRFFSFTLVFGTAFLLVVSLIVSTVLEAVAGTILPTTIFLWKVLTLLITFGVLACLFALMFKYLPDVRIRWRSVWTGALLTAALFTAGKFLLAWYLGRGSTTSVYGTFGALVALLLWVYYSSAILFFGAEFTQAYARVYSGRRVPAENAVPMTQDERDRRGMPAPEAIAAAADPNYPAPYFPSVPINRDLAIAGNVTAAGSSGWAGKLLSLAAGVAVGKFLLGHGKKPKVKFMMAAPAATSAGRSLAFHRLIEPGFATRRRLDSSRLIDLEGEHARLRAERSGDQYAVQFRPPLFAHRLAKRAKRTYHAAKARIQDYARNRT